MVDGQKSTNITVYTQCHKPRLVLYPNIYAIFTVLITMPVSSVSSERSFSAMRRVKNCLYKSYNARMGDERLSNLWLLHIHRTRNSKSRRCYQQTSGLYLITRPCCWTWWLHVLTWTLKLYSLNVSFIHFAFMTIFAIDSMLCDAEFL